MFLWLVAQSQLSYFKNLLFFCIIQRRLVQSGWGECVSTKDVKRWYPPVMILHVVEMRMIRPVDARSTHCGLHSFLRRLKSNWRFRNIIWYNGAANKGPTLIYIQKIGRRNGLRKTADCHIDLTLDHFIVYNISMLIFNKWAVCRWCGKSESNISI